MRSNGLYFSYQKLSDTKNVPRIIRHNKNTGALANLVEYANRCHFEHYTGAPIGRPLIPYDFLKGILTSNFLDMGNFEAWCSRIDKNVVSGTEKRSAKIF